MTLDDWGLHLVDMNIVSGNLLEIVQQQGHAYVANASAAPTN